jgi:hypothetical protein
MDLEVDIDAALTLEQTQERCKVAQAGMYQLAKIEIGATHVPPVIEVNKAGFNEKLSGLLRDLSFVEGSVATKAGWTRLFDCQMYVASHVKTVTIFGK